MAPQLRPVQQVLLGDGVVPKLGQPCELGCKHDCLEALDVIALHSSKGQRMHSAQVPWKQEIGWGADIFAVGVGGSDAEGAAAVAEGAAGGAAADETAGAVAVVEQIAAAAWTAVVIEI